MNKNRIKLLKTPAIPTREQVEQFVLEIATAENKRRSLQAARDAAILTLDEIYAPEFAGINDIVNPRTAAVQAWAEANPAEFARRKTVSFTAGAIGFRTGTPKLKLLGRQTFEKMLLALRGLSWGAAYIRTKEEINKEQIIAHVGSRTLADTELLKAGAAVVQDETFFIEPNLTHTEPRQIAKAEAA
ncbi:MAG: Mu Gam family protein [Pedosphaera sp.]|nr:Mu Gam family protein [Pedosphaera sp.]